MTETRQQVVSLINTAHCTADADAKVECLEQTKELLIRKEPALLEEFLPEILNFQSDGVSHVRRFVVGYLEAALPARPAAALVHRAAACLSALLADSVVAVAKAALQAALGFLKLAVVLCASLGVQPQPPHAAREAWEAAMQVPKHAGALVTRSGNAGTKLLAVQVVKEAALLLSAPLLPLCASAPSLQPPTSLQGNSVVTAADLGTEADALVGCLAELLEPSTVQELMSKAVVVTHLIKAVGDVADKRPIYVGQFLPRLAALQASLHIRFIGSSKDGKGGQVLGSAASVANSLKAALLTLLSSTQSEVQVWESSLTKVLADMGLMDAANNTIRLRNRVLRRHERDTAEASLPPGTDGQPPAPTRPRLSSSEEPAASNHASQDPPPLSTPAPTLAPVPAPVPAPAPVPQQQPAAPGRAEALLSVLGILGSLAGTNSHAALEAFVDCLTPSTLADVVLNNLAHCPPTLPPHLAAPASPPPASALVPPVAPETAAMAPALAPLRSPPPRSPPAMDVVGPPLEPAGSILKKSVAVVVGPLRALPLSDVQATDLRNSAMQRLLSTSRSNARSTHGLLLAKLCSSSCPEAVVQEILDRWETRDGPALAGQLLACMYVRCGMSAASCQLQQQAAAGERMEVDGGDEAGAGIKAEAGTVAGGWENGLGGPVAGSGSSGYEEVLRRLLDGLAQKVPLKIEQSLELMLDAPHLPPQLLQSFLHGLCEGAHATDGLALAFHLCRQRAPCRWAALQVILDQAVGVLPVVQHKASVLLVTKVHPLAAMTQAVEAYATAALDALCLHQPPPAAAAGATEPSGSGTRDGGWRAAGTGLKLPKALTREEVQQMSEERVQQYCKLYLALMTRKPALLPRLFQVFSATLPGVQSAMVALIRQQNIGQMLPVRSQELLQALTAAHEASLPLLQAVLETQTAPANGRWPHKQVPSAEYVAACRALHNRVQALWTLLPAVAAMHPTEVRRSVVPMLTQLYPLTAPGAAPPEAAQRLAAEQQAAAVRIFTMQLPNGKRVMTPEDVLLRLHELDLRPPPDGYGMARVRRAIQHCLTDTQVFNKEVMAAVVNRMVQKTPFPTLMMRTLIDTYRAHPQLHSALLSHTADMLMRRGVWTDAQQFRGFLLLVKEAVPKSFELLFRLPRNKQVAALRSEPLLPLRGHIRDYAQLHGLSSRLAPEVQQLLQETPPPARPPAAAIPSTVKAE